MKAGTNGDTILDCAGSYVKEKRGRKSFLTYNFS